MQPHMVGYGLMSSRTEVSQMKSNTPSLESQASNNTGPQTYSHMLDSQCIPRPDHRTPIPAPSNSAHLTYTNCSRRSKAQVLAESNGSIYNPMCHHVEQ